MELLKGRVAVITGGGGGIGKAIALKFAGQGADIALGDLGTSAEPVAGQITALGRKALHQTLDVTKPEEVARFVDAVAVKFGKIHILVNCAGIVGKRSFIFMADDDNWRKIIEINLFGTYNCIKAVLPKIMEQKWGRIINMGSIAGKQASATNSAYCASKHGVIGITRSVATEVGLMGFGDITVNAICPGVVETSMVFGKDGVLEELSRLTGQSIEEVLEQRIKPMSIQKRLQTPDEIADMALYLASESARSITGQAINVDGGTTFY
jgi:NAD(P)-dependent dehydrogenase (short-subunit alcohol dehydrogenase family)